MSAAMDATREENAPEAKPRGPVVVAVSSVARRDALCDACREVGLDVRAAAHGVEALELALTEVPLVIAAEIGLPLLDAPRLAEILRSNPHTRGVRFLFLGDEQTLGNGGGVGDRVAPAGLRAEELVTPIVELLERKSQIDALEDERRREGRASGDLSQLGLADLIELYHLSRKSGTLELHEEVDGQKAGAEGFVHLREGEVIAAETADAEERKALFRMLDWSRGRFLLRPLVLGHEGPPLGPTRSLLGEGLRQRAEAQRQAPQLPALDAQVRLPVGLNDLPPVVNPLTEEVLVLADLHDTVGEVVQRCRYPDYQVLRTLRSLEERGILELHRTHVHDRAHRGGGLFDDEQRRRLLDWIGADSRADAKLLVAPSHPQLALDLCGVLRNVPGVRLSGEAERGALATNDLAPLARIALDADRSIEVLHVPVGAEFAPLWPLLTHRSLGTLQLFGTPVSKSIEALQPFDENVRALPRARLFNLVVLPPGERASASDLQDHLSLLDQASLFFLPLGSQKPAATLFRSLFARIVP